MAKDKAIKAAVVTGVFVVVAAIIGALVTHWFGLTTPSVQATPTQSSTSSSSTIISPTATASPGITPLIYYQGTVTIAGNGRDFDTNPPGPGPGAGAFYYNTSALETGGSNTAGLAVWRQRSRPTAADCKAFATANGISDISVVAGMKICFETGQGRFGLLSVQPATSANELIASATVWDY
jgi:hypothetical protein